MPADAFRRMPDLARALQVRRQAMLDWPPKGCVDLRVREAIEQLEPDAEVVAPQWIMQIPSRPVRAKPVVPYVDQLIGALRDRGPLTAKELGAATGVQSKQVYALLDASIRRGLVVRVDSTPKAFMVAA